jgi:hypothetical protein
VPEFVRSTGGGAGRLLDGSVCSCACSHYNGFPVLSIERASDQLSFRRDGAISPLSGFRGSVRPGIRPPLKPHWGLARSLKMPPR